MYSGELRRVTFEYIGQSIEAVLDRLATAEILSEMMVFIQLGLKCMEMELICG